MINVYLAKKFCKEDLSKIENYDKAISDKTQTWHCHHRTEIWWNCSKKDLIENECYYGRKACELIFLTPTEHKSLHSKGKIVSEETKQKMSKALKGHLCNEETKRKISAANKGKIVSEETRIKIGEASKGRYLSEETKKKISEARKKYLANKRGEI